MLDLTEVTRTVILPNGEPLEILKGINLHVDAGEHVSIVGQSGTGKSTLMNIIGMLDLPNSGTYMWQEHNVASLTDRQRSQLRGESIGFVFQQFNLFSTRDAVSNVAVPLLYSSGMDLLRRNEIAADMLERVGLGDRLDAMPSQLSGGEQQRVALARALVRRPRIILADEPTGALDLHTGEQMMNLLEECVRQFDAALIVITHDMQIARRAERIMEIVDGRISTVSPLSVADMRRGEQTKNSERGQA
ncbi:MAG: ABC transporter ATP-binding protein [Varibaculum sp.]|nr:ABC transporter ATP-binding protein [Varibaculum sp.]